jgi:hypothetical protein
MTAKQAAFLTSRIISLWFFYRAFSTLVQVPAAFAMVSAFSSLKNTPGFDGYSAKLFAESGAIALQGCAEIILAILFYRCGPWVARFLLGEDTKSEVGGQNPA